MNEKVYIVTFGEQGQGVSIISVWKNKMAAIDDALAYMKDTTPGVKWEWDEHRPVWYDRGDQVAVREMELRG